MSDKIYCYPNSDVLINKLNITNRQELFDVETELTYLRLEELQQNPIEGNFDFAHLKEIHKYIFQDLYDWAGKERTVEIGKGNLFCTTANIQEYAKSVFDKYHPQCISSKNNFNEFIDVFAKNYGDLNALHPFREGNGRAQREFARLICIECGYDFDLSSTSHQEMLSASRLSFDKADNSELVKIFQVAVTPYKEEIYVDSDHLHVLTRDDLSVDSVEGYEYYDRDEYELVDKYDSHYKSKIAEMDAEQISNDFNEPIDIPIDITTDEIELDMSYIETIPDYDDIDTDFGLDDFER